MPRARRMSASSAPPSVSRPSRAAAAVSRSPDITALRASRTRSRRDRRRLGAVERLPVGRRGHRVADGVEQVAPQRQRRRPVRTGGVRAARRRPAPARRGRHRPPPRSRRRGGGRARRRPSAPGLRAGGGRCGPPTRAARSGGWRRRGGSGDAGGAARRRGARRARARGGTGSRRSPARRSARRGRRRGGRTPRPPAGRTRATNSSVSNDEPTTATRCRTSRVAGAMPPIMLASRACTQRGSLAARRASSFTANGMPRPSAAICSTSSAAGSATWRRTSAAMSSSSERAELELGRRRGGRSGSGASRPACRSIGAGRWVSTMHTRWSRVERAM